MKFSGLRKHKTGASNQNDTEVDGRLIDYRNVNARSLYEIKVFPGIIIKHSCWHQFQRPHISWWNFLPSDYNSISLPLAAPFLYQNHSRSFLRKNVITWRLWTNPRDSLVQLSVSQEHHSKPYVEINTLHVYSNWSKTLCVQIK